MNTSIFHDMEQLSHAAARYVVQVANEALAAHGRFTIAISGGSTPKKLYSLLALEPYCKQIDWTKAEIFWSDERCVPPDDAESNYRLAHEVMLSKLPIPASHIHRMPANQSNRVVAAIAYEQELRCIFDTDGIPSFDLISTWFGTRSAHSLALPTPSLTARNPTARSLRDRAQATSATPNLNATHTQRSQTHFIPGYRRRKSRRRPSRPEGRLPARRISRANCTSHSGRGELDD